MRVLNVSEGTWISLYFRVIQVLAEHCGVHDCERVWNGRRDDASSRGSLGLRVAKGPACAKRRHSADRLGGRQGPTSTKEERRTNRRGK